VGREHLKRWTFEEAMGALEKKLKALKIPILGEEEALHQPLAGPPPLQMQGRIWGDAGWARTECFMCWRTAASEG